MFLSVEKVALRLDRDEYVEHSLLIIQRRKFGAGLKTVRTEVSHSAVNSIRYAATVVSRLSVEERDSKKR
jgi:hypothetical protein